MGISIYIVINKKTRMQKFTNYKFIQAGAYNKSKEFISLNDGRHNSIAKKNKNYCELTALYWLWKNEKLDDIVGMCHYRRLFFLNSKSKYLIKKVEREPLDIDDKISTESVSDILKTYDIILPVPNTCLLNMRKQYSLAHKKSDFETMQQVLYDLYPEYKSSAKEVFSRKYIYFYNMFITHKSIFCDYAKWLFPILFELEKRIEIPNDDIYQRRVFGFLAERLLNLYVYHKKLKIKEFPIIYIANQCENAKDEYQDMKYYIKKYSFVNLGFLKRFSNHKW